MENRKDTEADGRGEANAGDTSSIPGSGRSAPHPPRGGNGNPLQDSCHRNPIDRGAWRAKSHGLAKSQTRLSGWLAAGGCPTWTERHPQAPRPLWTPRACRIAPVWSCEHKEKKHSILVLGNVAFIRGKLKDEILRTQDRPKTAVQPQGGDVLGDRGHAGLNHKGVLLLFGHLTAHRSYAFTITYNFILDPFRERSVIMTKLRQSCDIFVNTVAVESLSRLRPFVTPWMQHARPPCPSPTPGVCSNSGPLSQ